MLISGGAVSPEVPLKWHHSLGRGEARRKFESFTFFFLPSSHVDVILAADHTFLLKANVFFALLAPAAPSQGYSVILSWVSIHLKPVLYICWSPRCLLGPKGWAWQVLVPILSPNLRAAAAEGMQPLHGHEHQHVPNCSLGCSAANWPNKNDQIEISTFLKTGSLQTAGKWRWKTSQGKPKLTSVFYEDTGMNMYDTL